MTDEGAAPAGSDDEPLVAARLASLAALEAAAAADSELAPFVQPRRFAPTASAAKLHREYGGIEADSWTGDHVTVAGRVVARRDFGKLTFLVVRDWSGDLQLYLDVPPRGVRVEAIDLGDWVGASGEVMATKRGELSVRVAELTLLRKSLRPLPEKWHGLKDQEQRYRQRYLDLAVNEAARHVMRMRTGLVGSLRSTLTKRGFIEVETPMLQVQPGGALARPFVTRHEALGIDMYLRIAPELYLKRLVVGGVERVFELNRNFRNEGVSPKYNPEFTMLEVYAAYWDHEDIMTLTEELVRSAAIATRGSTELEYQERVLDVAPPYPRVGLAAATSAALGRELSVDVPVGELRTCAAGVGVEVDGAWGPGKILTEIFERCVEPQLWEPTFIVDYPKEVSPLARVHPHHPALTERFELFVGGLEVANGFTEENDPIEQRARFEAQARARAEGDEEAHWVDEDYLRALEYGLPPTGGLGVGVDRLAMILADAPTIREVILFPHLRPV